MDRKLGAIGLLLAAGAANAESCDWKIKADKPDLMTDERMCLIVSDSAHLGFSVQGKTVSFLTGSAYRSGRDGLTVRIDDMEAIRLAEHRSTDAFRDNARRAMEQIRGGTRLRYQFLDHPASKDGEVLICDLPKLIESCKS